MLFIPFGIEIKILDSVRGWNEIDIWVFLECLLNSLQGIWVDAWCTDNEVS